MRDIRKIGVAAVAALVVAAGVYWGMVRDGDPASAVPAAGRTVIVEAAPVQVRPVQQEVNAIGTLRSEDSIVMRPELAGVVTAIGFKEGQPVRKGQLLVALDGSIHEAELAQAQASLTLSRANNDRTAELLAKGAASQRTRDENLSKMRMDEATLALARARLAKTRITAPYDGVAGLRKVAVGDYVTPGQDLVTLDVIDPIKLEFRVPEIYLAHVAMGQTVTFQLDALPGQTFKAEVYAIDPQVDVDGRSLAIRARADNSGRTLRPGLFARASLGLARHENAILIPEEAIIPQGTDHFVYKVTGGKAAMTQVKTGIRRDGVVEIVSGLGAADTVVTAGQLKLHDGAAVNVRSASAD
ncbi:efflux RND transporter periplasmic adaptor subunit [Emcibacter sp. SYSU 3D8]|uniref:efflux RND transporter periplasmic adaptor subunit n=1 Tax=Emcibacter sp. SYSU 3D8 TaxID=3133969 RepID=UPI0031FEA296